MNLYNVYFVSKGTGPRTVQIEALNSAGVKAQIGSRYPEGETLEKLIKRSGRLEVKLALEL
jgi:hypothetical protein